MKEELEEENALNKSSTIVTLNREAEDSYDNKYDTNKISAAELEEFLKMNNK